MAKHMVIAMQILKNPAVEISDYYNQKFTSKLKLPDGCLGICYAFESKKAARKFFDGKNISFTRIEYEKER